MWRYLLANRRTQKFAKGTKRPEKFQGRRFAHLDFDTTISSKDINKKRKINNGIGLKVSEQIASIM